MKGDQIKYRSGYKYSLWNTYRVQTDIKGYTVTHRLFTLSPCGLLTVFEDYPWDGASSLTIDSGSSMRASLVHDVLYEMMRLGLLPESCFHAANQEFYKILLEDGMWGWRAKAWYKAVEDFGHPNAAVSPPKIKVAP